MKKIYHISIILFSIKLLACQSVDRNSPTDGRQKEKMYTGRGEALLLKPEFKARQTALNLAMQDALKKGVGVFISSMQVVSDGEQKMQQILAQSEGYIRSYKIIEESKKDGLYIIIIKAVIDEKKIEQSFSDRISRMIEKTPIGPCSVSVQASLDFRLFDFSMVCAVNDPSIDSTSVKINFSDQFIEPEIQKTGIGYVIMVKYKDQELAKQKKGIVRLLKENKIFFRFLDPAKKAIRETQSNIYRIDYWNLGTAVNKEEGSGLEWNTKAAAKLEQIRIRLAESLDAFDTFWGYCNLQIYIDRSADLADGSFVYNWQCFMKDLDKEKLTIMLPHNGSLSDLEQYTPKAENPFSYFTGKDIFVLNCRDHKKYNFRCSQDILGYITELRKNNNSALKIEKSGKSGKMEIRSVKCEIKDRGKKISEEKILPAEKSKLKKCQEMILTSKTE